MNMQESKGKSVSEEDALRLIKSEAEKIAYGSVTAIVRDGQVVQVETNRKIRLDKKARGIKV